LILEHDQIASSDLINAIVHMARTALPLPEFGWAALRQ